MLPHISHIRAPHKYVLITFLLSSYYLRIHHPSALTRSCEAKRCQKSCNWMLVVSGLNLGHLMGEKGHILTYCCHHLPQPDFFLSSQISCQRKGSKVIPPGGSWRPSRSNFTSTCYLWFKGKSEPLGLKMNEIFKSRRKLSNHQEFRLSL